MIYAAIFLAIISMASVQAAPDDDIVVMAQYERIANNSEFSNSDLQRIDDVSMDDLTTLMEPDNQQPSDNSAMDIRFYCINS